MSEVLGNPNCAACGLDRASNLPIYGNGKKGLLVLFDAQLPVHSMMGSYGAGYEYSFIRDILYQYGIVMEEDCFLTSAIRCRIDQPQERYVQYCSGALEFLLGTLKPKVILTVGPLSARYVLGEVVPGALNLERVHGFIHNNRKHQCYTVSTWVPFKEAYNTTISNKIIERDIMQAVIALTMPYRTWKGEASCITMLNKQQALEWLANAVSDNRTRWEAIDYETTGLRPYNKGHHIVSCAISNHIDHSYSFMVDEEVLPYLREYLDAPHIKKIAHNLAFELMWSKAKVGTWGRSMNLDTMVLMHALDNRDTKITSVKFLAPMLLGCQSWESEVSKYLKADRELERQRGNNAINNIKQIPQRVLLRYNGIDSLVELRCAVVMMRMLSNINKTFPTLDNIGHWEELLCQI